MQIMLLPFMILIIEFYLYFIIFIMHFYTYIFSDCT
jgi:hypothetical protein